MVQSDELSEPLLARYLPAAQFVHEVAVPVAEAYVPAGQSVQAEALAAEYLPATQLVQAAEPAIEYFPASQPEQLVDSVVPVPLTNKPAAQLEQLDEDDGIAYLPAAQVVQAVAPSTE